MPKHPTLVKKAAWMNAATRVVKVRFLAVVTAYCRLARFGLK
jgi:hypothetical protein